jgi:hypothetical protein
MLARVAVMVGGVMAGGVLACVQPLPLEGRACPCDEPEWVCCGTACVPRERSAACPGRDGAATQPPTGNDAASPASMSDTGAAVPDAPADPDVPVVPTDASSEGDAPGVVPADGPPDRPDVIPAEPCQGPARGCSGDRTATLRCEEERWVFEQTCVDGTACSAGDCVCRAGSCQDSVPVRLAASIPYIAVGGDYLYYVKDNGDTNVAGLHRLNLRTNEPSAIVPDGPDQSFGIMVADATGLLTWCRGMGSGQAGPAIMRGTQVFEAVPCGRVAVSDTHVYFTRGDQAGIFRRALDQPGRQTLWQGDRLGWRVAGPFLFVARLDDGPDESLSVFRLSVAGMQVGQPERIAGLGQFFDPSFYSLQIDDDHVYADDGDGVVRAPLTPGGSFQTFWRGPGPEMRGLALSPTHVYWSTSIEATRGCAEATVWRQRKAAGAAAEAVASYPGACPGMDLLLAGDYLYTVITSSMGGAQIVRLRL